MFRALTLSSVVLFLEQEYLLSSKSVSAKGRDSMDVMKILNDLRQEREIIEEAIITLERLARGQGKRRGRPPAWMAALRDKEKQEAAEGAETPEPAAPVKKARPAKGKSA